MNFTGFIGCNQNEMQRAVNGTRRSPPFPNLLLVDHAIGIVYPAIVYPALLQTGGVSVSAVS